MLVWGAYMKAYEDDSIAICASLHAPWFRCACRSRSWFHLVWRWRKRWSNNLRLYRRDWIIEACSRAG